MTWNPVPAWPQWQSGLTGTSCNKLGENKFVLTQYTTGMHLETLGFRGGGGVLVE